MTTILTLDVDAIDGRRSEVAAATLPGAAATLYRNFCAEANCRPNSAVLRFLDSAAASKPLTELPLVNCYVGPRGFPPVVRLIESFQTLESIDVRGNGLDNSCAALLCSALEKHLGVRSVLLDDNPITVDGGKHILHMLERNRRIVAVSVAGTDIYETICQRIAMVLQENESHCASNIALVPSKPASAPSTVADGRALSARPSTRPGLSVVEHAATQPSQATEGSTPSAKRKPHAASLGIAEHDGPGAVAPKPRPPPPALASREASRLSDKQRQELVARYNERAQLYQQVVRSDASRAADKAREELMMIEQRRVVDAVDAKHVAARSSSSALADGRSRSPKTDSPVKTRIVATEPSVTDFATATSANRWSVSELPPAEVSPLAPADQPRRRTMQMTAAPSDDSTAETDDYRAPLVLQPLTLTRDEQFKELFARGCQQYNDKQLDAAYLTWNEAMDLAANSKNREWMSVISSNLQRLSYEILVSEGVRRLEAHNLEEADKSFVLALDVATTAKNAQWEGEMHRARKNVQHAVFQRCHEAATRLFERAQAQKDNKVTSDDRFRLPNDPDGLREHTSEFVAEWTRMLLIKEALEMWADACTVTRRIGGSSGKVLQEVVSAAVNSVCGFLARKFFVSEPQGNTLSLQRTSKFTYYEACRLTDLWTDLISKTQTTLANRTWDAVAASELGHLFLATHQLPQALNQFEKLVDLASSVKDQLLTALGHTYVGILHWQRSNYSVAEKSFAVALEHWKVIRTQRDRIGGADDSGAAFAVPQDDVPLLDDAAGNAAPHGADAGDVPSALAAHVSPEFLNVMLHKCYTYLIRILFSTSRYRDALEMLERGLLHKYHDRLHDKMVHNFTSRPTMDHIVAVARALGSPMVYYETSYRFEWSTQRDAYLTSQQLMVWVVPRDADAEMKVVRVDVTADFGVDSIDTLITAVRKGLVVDPIANQPANDAIVTMLPENSWKEPLRKLYDILIYPISDFLNAHDAYANHKGGLITIVPTSTVWLVPFNALIQRTGKYLVEDYATQFAFCAVQAAFSGLSAKRIRDRDLKRRVVVVQPESATDGPLRFMNENRSLFPLDALRSVQEGQRVLKSFGADSRPKSLQNTTASVVLSENECVEDLHALRDVMQRCRHLHFAVAASATVDNDDGSVGALIVAVGQDEMGLLRASELSQYEIFAEMVVLSNANMATDRVRGTKEGVLGLCRSLLSAGVGAVVAAQWCTPDMVPAEVFDGLYHTILAGKETHKARALALTTRRLLADDRFRYSPRLWSGYFVLGASLI